VLFFLLWCFVAYLLTDRPNYASRLWVAITTASRRSDFEKARRLAETAVKQYPRDYWSHEWLANVEFEEVEYQRAYDLVPNERIKKRLQEIHIRAAAQHSPTPSPAPRP
jgi:hypothetical protein